MSLLFNKLSRFVIIAFLPRSKCLLISWLQSPSIVILEPKKIESATVFIFSPSACHEVMGLDVMILVFWVLSCKPAFSLSFFTFIKRLEEMWISPWDFQFENAGLIWSFRFYQTLCLQDGDTDLVHLSSLAVVLGLLGRVQGWTSSDGLGHPDLPEECRELRSHTAPSEQGSCFPQQCLLCTRFGQIFCKMLQKNLNELFGQLNTFWSSWRIRIRNTIYIRRNLMKCH